MSTPVLFHDYLHPSPDDSAGKTLLSSLRFRHMENLVSMYIHLIIFSGLGIALSLDTTPNTLHSTAHLLCKHNVSADNFLRVKWFKSSRELVFEHNGRALVSWDNTSDPYTTGNYDIDKDFSLILYNILIEDEGIYRCQITKNDKPYSLDYDVKLMVYALPRNAPLIQRVNDTFNCSVDRVYPLLYPQVELKHQKYAVLNEDGTYNTSVSGSIQDIRGEAKVVYCSFPYFNYSQVSSLSLCPTTTISVVNDNESDIPMSIDVTAQASSSHGTKTTNIVVMSIFFIAAVISSICQPG